MHSDASAQSKLDQILNELPGVDGLDANRGLSLSNFNATLYVAMLGKFAKSQPSTINDLRQALAIADSETAERLAHTLKGLCASIGAMPLHQSMADIELALHHGQATATIAHLLEPARVQLQALVAQPSAKLQVIPAFAPIAQIVVAPTQHVEIKKVMHALRELLEQDDSEVQTLWETHAPALRSALPQAQAQALEQAIQGFEFEEVLRLMEFD